VHVLFSHAARPAAPGGNRLKTATALQCLRYTQVFLLNLKVQATTAQPPLSQMPDRVGKLRGENLGPGSCVDVCVSMNIFDVT